MKKTVRIGMARKLLLLSLTGSVGASFLFRVSSSCSFSFSFPSFSSCVASPFVVSSVFSSFVVDSASVFSVSSVVVSSAGFLTS